MKFLNNILRFSFICVVVLSCDMFSSDRNGFMEGKKASDVYSDDLTIELAIAAGKGDTKEIDKLIAKGADVNATGEFGAPVLVWPFKTQNLKGFKYLMQRGANPDAIYKPGSHDQTVMSYAVLFKDYDFIEAMIQAGANLDIMVGTGPSSPLVDIIFIEGENLEIVKLLVVSGANIDLQMPGWGVYAVEMAIYQSKLKTALYLLQQGADYSLLDANDDSAMTAMFDQQKFMDPDYFKYDKYYPDYKLLLDWFDEEGVDLGFEH